MNAITTTSNAAAIIPAGDLRPALFEEFIKYIDRGQKTTRTYITNLRQFAAFLAYKGIRRPQRQDVISYRDYLTTEHEAIQYNPATGWTYRTDRSGRRYTTICKPTTVKIYLQSVRQFFSWTAANGFYPDIAANIHAPKVRHDVHRKDALTAADVAVNAGLRTIEISRANVRDLEVRNGRAVLYVWGKGHTEADAKKPLAPEVYAAIRDYLDSRSDRPTANSPLFVSTGNRSGGKRIAETTISKMLKQAMQAAGFNSDRITAHTLRHTAGTNVQEITGNLYITQKYMRHANPATTEIYLHNDTEKQETQTAQDLYNLYHGITAGDDRAQLEALLQRMTPAQLAQLTGIASAIAG